MDPSLEGLIGDYLKGQLPQEAIHLQMDRLLTQAIGTLERWVTPYLQPTTPLYDLDEAFEQMDESSITTSSQLSSQHRDQRGVASSTWLPAAGGEVHKEKRSRHTHKAGYGWGQLP